MGVGDYVIVKDKYKENDVNYYVEKEYAPVAKKIFGETPAMIGFYEKITEFLMHGQNMTRSLEEIM